MPSDATNKQIIRDGVQCVAAEPCFPMKGRAWHVVDPPEEGGLSLPAGGAARRVLDEEFCESQTCPYIQVLLSSSMRPLQLEPGDPQVLTLASTLTRALATCCALGG